ncbi:hypothetical protein DFR58_103252 [Anaerobacterium chartisolvens]|uniref:DUF4062 domain-containing protein n=1 Tax=Anaerobacterium chartisolvens TaxID=1297424 RepID=A0A369BE51_9FIRM|nr:hypothetical protein [Anaerobacterium chartisolvens]RCX19505.1 hypothetical protein DFR58_103252 [Anaerobacterium chartisolvens]
MAKNVIQYDLLISCPGDIQREIDIIKEVVEQFNELYSDPLGINIRSRHWSKSSYAQSGDKPQELLNKQFVKDCDAAIAIFWTRFGTPTDRYGSGSEEEIEIMLDAGKQVFMYFSEKPITPSSIDDKQYVKVNEFKDRYKGRGLYFTYSSDEDFRKLFFAHLSQYFLILPKITELVSKARPQLKLKSVYEGQLYEDAYIGKFILNSDKDSKAMQEKILKLFSKISQNKLGSYHNLENSILGTFYKAVEISDVTKECIRFFAGYMKIEIADDFFNLGHLRENHLSTPTILGRGRTFEGTDAESKKYDNIITLEKAINELLNWIPIEKCFENLSCIQFLLSNEGTTFDEDIDIELEFESGTLLHHKQLPLPEEGSLEYACNDCSLAELFGINGTALFMDYDSSRKPLNHPVSSSVPMSGYSFLSRDYVEDYKENLDDVFEYDYYQSDSSCIVKLHIDYIKQHTVVAFPTPIFVTENIVILDIGLLQSATQKWYREI